MCFQLCSNCNVHSWLREGLKGFFKSTQLLFQIFLVALRFLRVGNDRQSFKLAIGFNLSFLQVSQGVLSLCLRHQPSSRWMSSHLIVHSLLFNLIFTLILKLVNVAWDFSIVLVLACHIILFSCGLPSWLHLENSLVHVRFNMIFRLTSVQLGDIVGSWHRIFGCGWTDLLVALLAGEDLTASVLRSSVLHGAGTGPPTGKQGHARFALLNSLANRLRRTCLFRIIHDNVGLRLLEVVDALSCSLWLQLLWLAHGSRWFRWAFRRQWLFEVWGHRGFRLPLLLLLLLIVDVALHLNLSLVGCREGRPCYGSTPTSVFLLHP